MIELAKEKEPCQSQFQIIKCLPDRPVVDIRRCRLLSGFAQSLVRPASVSLPWLMLLRSARPRPQKTDQADKPGRTRAQTVPVFFSLAAMPSPPLEVSYSVEQCAGVFPSQLDATTHGSQ